MISPDGRALFFVHELAYGQLNASSQKGLRRHLPQRSQVAGCVCRGDRGTLRKVRDAWQNILRCYRPKSLRQQALVETPHRVECSIGSTHRDVQRFAEAFICFFGRGHLIFSAPLKIKVERACS